MRVWVYGSSPGQIQRVIEEAIRTDDTVAGTSVQAEAGSAFPQSGLTPAMSAAIRGSIDFLLIPTFDLFGDKTEMKQTMELFQRYGVVIRSASSDGINNS